MIATAEPLPAELEFQGKPNAQGKLPPTERDFELFQRIQFDGLSTRSAAEKFGLSQTRVRQVAVRVVEFLARAVPEELPEQTKEQRLFAAEQLARLQLESLYREAMQQWHASQQQAFGLEAGLGKTRYLIVAARIVSQLAKIPVHPLPAFREDDDAAADAPAASAAPQESPPVRDCSPEPLSRGPEAVTSRGATASGDSGYEPKTNQPHDAKSAFFAPAQLGVEGDQTAAAAPLAPAPLNRRERKMRERLLKQKRFG